MSSSCFARWGVSNFAMSFSIISILIGAGLLHGYGLKIAGPMVNSIGWPVVSGFTLCVAASMAELASARLREPRHLLRQCDRHHHRWRDVAPWPRLDHIDGPHVVRLCPG